MVAWRGGFAFGFEQVLVFLFEKTVGEGGAVIADGDDDATGTLHFFRELILALCLGREDTVLGFFELLFEFGELVLVKGLVFLGRVELFAELLPFLFEGIKLFLKLVGEREGFAGEAAVFAESLIVEFGLDFDPSPASAAHSGRGSFEFFRN